MGADPKKLTVSCALLAEVVRHGGAELTQDSVSLSQEAIQLQADSA